MNLKIIFSVVLVIFCLSASTQTPEEWTQQKQTRIKRLLEQIIANKVYLEYVKKGYKIVSTGLHSIRDIKNGEFKLHLGYFDGLKTVNPKIKAWMKVADIIAYQTQIIKTGKQAIDAVRLSGKFSNEELDYCRKVFDQLLENCLISIDELLLVVTDGKTEMTDDERIKRIEKIYAGMQDKSSFALSFSNEMHLLVTQRITEQAELNYSKKVNGH
ncbi:MAG: hypothetical protein GXC73_17325 [Chitinophagaceae bacterium]|nr:hypothetical protein [Chitinophagaceae bacterium]